MDLILYSREECHLCDDAWALALALAPGCALQVVDVDADPELEKRYGLRVPVLRVAGSDRELAWPFDASGLKAFLAGP